ncbi:hypothetical protein F383_37688 [Gossypium arboreum]|uniref:Uncharacterized protein n=1 Tax=Gossypium arboreum TaxID=29729 RepID=A0A0B0M866_GOSAR|nr:hypothetical protein F383_37688 [Gossypium arboreum]
MFWQLVDEMEMCKCVCYKVNL